ncbi:aromatic ring-opening dioxygenase LigA [Herbiconiux sp. P17]|uniref:aromatic ring-opening dioxygenase LigA n=1 Tax=Herbiconiux wuyangfengii TaxID=3342794 RepID=UPI0035BADD70
MKRNDAVPSATALRQVGGLAIAAGSLLVAVGAGAWLTVSKQLRDEKIEVPGNAPVLKGKRVQGPATAYVEALVIKGNAERGAGGRTFADISAALRGVDASSDEAGELRKQSLALSTAASLRTSLLTSVLAFGVSAFVTGLGAFFVIVGSILRRAER